MSGADYTERELETLSSIAAQVARTIHFLDGGTTVLTPAASESTIVGHATPAI